MNPRLYLNDVIAKMPYIIHPNPLEKPASYVSFVNFEVEDAKKGTPKSAHMRKIYTS